MNQNHLNPEVSIILPTYNRAKSLRRSVLSLINQVFEDLEIIIVDDGSTDETSQIISQIGDERIRYIEHRDNLGSNAARNTGIRLAQGKYIAFQDSDDEWFPDKLAVQLNAIKRAEINVRAVFCSFWRINGNKKELIPKSGRQIQACTKNWHNDLLEGNLITTQALLFERDLISEAGLFDESLQRFQDWEFVLRLSRFTSFQYIHRPLFNAYVTANSISNNNKIYFKTIEQIMENHRSSFRSRPDAQILQFIDMGVRALTIERSLKTGIFYFRKALSVGNPNDLLKGLSKYFRRTFQNFVKK